MNRKRKVMTLILVVALLFVLTSCSGGQVNKPISFDPKIANWFDWILVIPVGWVMQLFAGLFNNNFAAGIIITTIIIRTIAWPIYAKSSDMSLKMAIMQPDIQRLQAKYAHRQDTESQQRMRMEMAAIYKKHNFNPLGCFMPLVQMPIFIAVYQTVQRIWITGYEKDGVIYNGVWADKVSDMNFLTIDLSLKGNLGLIFGKGGDWKGWILAIVVLITNIVLNYIAMLKPSYQKQTHTHTQQAAEAEQSQKMMKYMQIFMIVMMFGIALNSNSLALYWAVGNTYSIGQTLVNRKINERKYYKMKHQDLVVKKRD